jgi:riboflavin kinase/FMN adenylyltransferase
MKLVYDLSQMPALRGTVVTDGMFDGMHLGHQRILKQVVEEAKLLGLPSVLVTYWPHPRHILSDKSDKLKLLTTLEEKAELVEKQGIDYMLVVSFTKLFSQLSHQEFVSRILAETLNTRRIIIGYDHRFGQNRMGDIVYLRQAAAIYGFDIQEIGKQEVEEIAISSTKIRQALQAHQVGFAAQLLGRNYALHGRVIMGDQRGRTIGFPTANLELDEPDKLIPADGVYASKTYVNGKAYSSMTNIGFRPTVDGKEHSIETHLLDFDENLYGQNLKIEFVKSIRMEQKFTDLDALKNQLAQDEMATRQILNP